MGWFQRTFWTLAAGGGIYVVAILALTIPHVQRNATYAHNVNPTIFQNLTNVDQFGFHRHQVQPFNFTTPDGTVVYAWHILPVHLYRKHVDQLRAQPDFGLQSFADAVKGLNLRLLLENPSANVVVSFHGNAGHLASSYRPATYQQILGLSSAEKPVHVIAFDYRGFGLSSGSPTEQGVIEDGVTLLSLLTGHSVSGSSDEKTSHIATTSRLDPSQIVLVGQSFGTFVSTAVFHDWTIRLQRASLKGLILFASFTTLPKLLDSYSIKGLTPPLLSPLMGYPKLQKWIMSKIEDKWETAPKLQEMVRTPDLKLDLTIMHAMDDWEIPWTEGQRNWKAVLEATDGAGTVESSEGPYMHIGKWCDDAGDKIVRWERIEHGGHNRIPVSEQAKFALLEVLDQ